MKIGFFANTYLPNTYGSTTSIRMFRKGLEELGHEVFVFAPAWKGYEDKETNIFRYFSVMYRYKIEYPVAASYSFRINKIVKDLDLDLIHSQQPFSIGKDGLRQARRNNLPIVFTHHCRYDQYIHYMVGVPEKPMKWHVNRAATNFANNCDAVVAPSEEIKDDIMSKGVKKEISVIPTGIETERFLDGNRGETRKKLGIKENEVVLMNLGRIQEEKNLKMLAEAAAKVMKKHKNVKFLLVGEGALKDPIREMMKKEGLANRAIITGLVKQEKVQHLYAASDIFLHTSMSETQGITVNEAMTAGLAVVAVRATGPADVVEDGRTGVLTRNNLDEFAQETEKLVVDAEKRRKIAETARGEAHKWDYKSRAREMERLYKRVIKQRKK